jgi:hypothetical protein
MAQMRVNIYPAVLDGLMKMSVIGIFGLFIIENLLVAGPGRCECSRFFSGSGFGQVNLREYDAVLLRDMDEKAGEGG